MAHVSQPLWVCFLDTPRTYIQKYRTWFQHFRSLQLVLNQENFQEFIKTLQETSIKAALRQLKLENSLICYIDDLLLATPKSLGVDLHLVILEFVLEMMCKFGFRVNRKKCNILCETVTFLGVELHSGGSNGIPLERRNLLANICTPRI